MRITGGRRNLAAVFLILLSRKVERSIIMEKFFLGEDLDRAERAARLLHRLTGKTVYINEDFGSDSEDDPWAFS